MDYQPDDAEHGEILRSLLHKAQQCEGAAHVEGTWNGIPFIAIVAVGANVGLVKKYAKQGALRLFCEE